MRGERLKNERYDNKSNSTLGYEVKLYINLN